MEAGAESRPAAPARRQSKGGGGDWDVTQQQGGRCWYCGGFGLSKEHVFAKSLIKLFPGHGTVRHAYEHPELG